MYSELGAKVVTEKQGLLPVSEGRPADIFVPAMVHQTSKNIALDLCIIDPASKSALTTNPSCEPLGASEHAAKEKMKKHRSQLREARNTEQRISYVKTPIPYEITGAYGEGAKKHWEKMIALHTKSVTAEGRSGRPPTRAQLGLPNTWAANTFTSYWSQRVAMSITYFTAATLFFAVEKVQKANPKPKKKKEEKKKEEKKKKPPPKKPPKKQPPSKPKPEPRKTSQSFSGSEVSTASSAGQVDDSSSAASSDNSKGKSKRSRKSKAPSVMALDALSSKSGSQGPSSGPFNLMTPKRGGLSFTNGSPSGEVSVRAANPTLPLDALAVEDQVTGRVKVSPGGTAHTSSRTLSQDRTAADLTEEHRREGRVRVNDHPDGSRTYTHPNMVGRVVTTKSTKYS